MFAFAAHFLIQRNFGRKNEFAHNVSAAGRDENKISRIVFFDGRNGIGDRVFSGCGGRNGNNAENNARQLAAAAAGVRFKKTGGGYCCYGRKLVLDRVDRVR